MRRIGILGLALSLSTGAFAQSPGASYPVKPVRFVVAFPPGGPTDLLARLIGQKLADSLSQPFVIENVVGATGTIAHGQVAKAAPDGYTILMPSISLRPVAAARAISLPSGFFASLI